MKLDHAYLAFTNGIANMCSKHHGGHLVNAVKDNGFPC